MKTLPLQYPGASILIVNIPDNLDMTSVERACRHVCEHGANPFPAWGRIDYHQLIRAGLDAGLLENPGTKEPR